MPTVSYANSSAIDAFYPTNRDNSSGHGVAFHEHRHRRHQHHKRSLRQTKKDFATKNNNDIQTAPTTFPSAINVSPMIINDAIIPNGLPSYSDQVEDTYIELLNAYQS